MLKKQIIRKNKGVFQVTTPGVPQGQLILNFNPIIEKFDLKGSFQLIHWQARPKKYREWGIYNSIDDSYQSLAGFQIEGVFKSLQIPDDQASAIPSAVLLLQSYG